MADTRTWTDEDRRQVNIGDYPSLKSLCKSFNATPFSGDDASDFVVFAIQSGVLENHMEGVVCYCHSDDAMTTYTREYFRNDRFRIGQRECDIKDHKRLIEVPCTRVVGLLLGFYEKSMVNRRKIYARRRR
jgi:hypothetical protein